MPSAETSAAPTAAPALKADRVIKRYGARTALNEVSFEVGAGELLAIIGPNGAGKTTLLQILSGNLAPDGGSVSRGRSEIGWVPQQPAVYGKLSVEENLRLFARLEKVGDLEGAVTTMLEQTGLTDRRGSEVATLSGGNKQRLNIAIGLLADPPVLLLDEPSSSLDPRQRQRMWEFVAARVKARGTTVVYSTHDVAEAERHADRVLVLADGELLFDGAPSAIVAERAERDFEAAFVAFLDERGH